MLLPDPYSADGVLLFVGKYIASRLVFLLATKLHFTVLYCSFFLLIVLLLLLLLLLILLLLLLLLILILTLLTYLLIYSLNVYLLGICCSDVFCSVKMYSCVAIAIR